MKKEEILRVLENELKYDLKKSVFHFLDEEHKEKCRIYFLLKAHNLLINLFYSAFIDNVDDAVREPKSILGWKDTFNSLLSKIDPVCELIDRFVSQYTTKVSESTLEWFIRFLKKEHNNPLDLSFPDFKFSNELYGGGVLIVLCYIHLSHKLPLHINLKIDILSQEVSKRIHTKNLSVTFRGQREVSRIKKTKAAKTKARSQRKQAVVDCYYRMADVKKDTKPYSVARLIHERLTGKIQDPPSIKTIYRYLKEDGLIH